MKKLSIIQYILAGVSVISIIPMFLSSGDAAAQPNVDFALYWAYILLVLAVGLVVVLPLINLVKNPQGALRSLAGLAIVVVLGVICYAMSSSAPVVNSAGGFFDDPAVLKLSDMGLYLTYIALGASILVAIGGELRNIFK